MFSCDMQIQLEATNWLWKQHCTSIDLIVYIEEWHALSFAKHSKVVHDTGAF